MSRYRAQRLITDTISELRPETLPLTPVLHLIAARLINLSFPTGRLGCTRSLFLLVRQPCRPPLRLRFPRPRSRAFILPVPCPLTPAQGLYLRLPGDIASTQLHHLKSLPISREVVLGGSVDDV